MERAAPKTGQTKGSAILTHVHDGGRGHELHQRVCGEGDGHDVVAVRWMGFIQELALRVAPRSLPG